MDINELIGLLNEVLRIDAKSDDGKKISFSLSAHMHERIFELGEETVNEILGYDDELLEDPVRIVSKRSCEFLIRVSSKMLIRYDEAEEYPDKYNQLTYRIGRPSLKMVIALLKKYKDGPAELCQEIRMRVRRMAERMESDGASILQEAVPIRTRFLQISLNDDNPNEKVDYLTLCTSFCFVSGYNLGRTLLPINSLDDLSDTSAVRRLRRGTTEEMEPPRRKYINELVYFYARGNSGETWDYQYLSYYHVLEYFFEKIYSDNMVAKMRFELTRPDFSYKRDRDLLNFEKTMRKTFKDLYSSSGVNEIEALNLTLKKYVPDLSKLRDGLNEVSGTIVNYIKTADTPYSTSKIDLDAPDTTGIYTAMTNRIYATRNAIAHSKESISKKKFVPFKHDKALINEVLLLRIIAEEVIINSSKEL